MKFFMKGIKKVFVFILFCILVLVNIKFANATENNLRIKNLNCTSIYNGQKVSDFNATYEGLTINTNDIHFIKLGDNFVCDFEIENNSEKDISIEVDSISNRTTENLTYEIKYEGQNVISAGTSKMYTLVITYSKEANEEKVIDNIDSLLILNEVQIKDDDIKSEFENANKDNLINDSNNTKNDNIENIENLDNTSSTEDKTNLNHESNKEHEVDFTNNNSKNKVGPKTGDNIIFYIFLMIISIIVMIIINVKFSKNKRKGKILSTLLVCAISISAIKVVYAFEKYELYLNSKIYIELYNNEETEEPEEPQPVLPDEKHWTGCDICSKENPHLISNTKQFNAMRDHINIDANGNEYIGGFFKLESDIIFSNKDFEEGGEFYNNGEGFIPIGLKPGPYTSLWTTPVYSVSLDLNGNNKTIQNIKISTNESQRSYNAIFARLDNGGKIYNLNLCDIYISATTSAGGIVRTIAAGSEISNIHVDNLNITATKYQGNMNSTGMVASRIDGKVSDIEILNSKLHSNSWFGAGISGAIFQTAEISNIKMDNCEITAYVDSGLICQQIQKNAKLSNINIDNTIFRYTHTNTGRTGILICTSDAEDNLPIIENSNIKIILDSTSRKLITSGGCNIKDSHITVIHNQKKDDMLIEAGDNAVLENSEIKYGYRDNDEIIMEN